MELCDQTLKEIIEEKNSSITPIIDYMIRIEIFRQLLFALNYLHSMTPKVIHRDIKPSNVLIKYYNDHAQVKLCDFGLSKILEKETSNTSNIGTTRYKAPEIFTNNYNEKVDIFSLGVMTQELFDKSLFTDTDKFDIYRKFNALKIIINKLIYSSPEERPSAEDIISNKSDWLIDNNADTIILVTKTKQNNNNKPLKFLNHSSL